MRYYLITSLLMLGSLSLGIASPSRFSMVEAQEVAPVETRSPIAPIQSQSVAPITSQTPAPTIIVSVPSDDGFCDDYVLVECPLCHHYHFGVCYWGCNEW